MADECAATLPDSIRGELVAESSLAYAWLAQYRNQRAMTRLGGIKCGLQLSQLGCATDKG